MNKQDQEMLDWLKDKTKIFFQEFKDISKKENIQIPINPISERKYVYFRNF